MLAWTPQIVMPKLPEQQIAANVLRQPMEMTTMPNKLRAYAKMLDKDFRKVIGMLNAESFEKIGEITIQGINEQITILESVDQTLEVLKKQDGKEHSVDEALFILRTLAK